MDDNDSNQDGMRKEQTKTGGAERGGPGGQKAMNRQPPDATRPSVKGPNENSEPIQGSGGLVNPVDGPDREIR